MICPDHILSRRNVLTVGAVGGLGLSLTDFLRIQSAQAEQKHFDSVEGTAKSVIFIFLPGGIAQQESFDPKPHAPAEYRGPLDSIATRLTGVRFAEPFKQTAKIADRLPVIRSMTHGEAAHERGVHNMFTGYRPSPAIQYPSIGSVVSHEFGPRNHLPPYVLVPDVPNEFAGPGYLSSAHAGFSLGSDPARGDYRVRDLSLPDQVDAQRFARRRQLTVSTKKRIRWSVRSQPEKHSISQKKTARSAIATAATNTARVCWWRDAWLRPVCDSCR